MTETDAAFRRIVVGVDGSPGGGAALARAAQEARLHGGVVHAVSVWGVPFTGATTSLAPAPYGIPDSAELKQAAIDELHRVVVAVLGDQPPVEVVEEVHRGSPARVLMEVAQGADLLVVGARGHGGFTGLLLGSVSAQVVRHAPCSVLVVRRPAEHRESLP